MFCKQCGKEIPADSVFCPACGTHQMLPTAPPPVAPVQSPALIPTLCQKIRTEAAIWIAVACVQAILGLISLVSESYGGGVLLVICVLNIVSAVNDLNFCKAITARPVGILQRYLPLGGLIASLVYNLLFGGIIGVVGVIFGFMTRQYVVEHQTEFTALEQQYADPKM